MDSVEYLKTLIRFPSVSSESNVVITEELQGWLNDLQFECERIDYVDTSGVTKACIVARKGPVSGPGLAYFCHTDVVPVETWSYRHAGPWSPFQDGNRIYGRGACDMKGSVAAMLEAAAIPAERLRQPLYFVATADEEIGFTGARKVVESSLFYRQMAESQTCGLIGEPTCLTVVHAHKGGRAIRVTSHGRAAHSSTGLGLNANMALIPFLIEVRNLNEEMETLPIWRDERFSPPTPTLNLVLHDRNSAINITSALSSCTVYFRPMPGQDAEGAIERLRAVAMQHGLEFEDLFPGTPVYTDPQSAFVQELLALTGQTNAKTVAYGTDGAVLTELKNLVILGPGDIAQAHTDDEWISIEQLQAGSRLFRRCIEHWCC